MSLKHRKFELSKPTKGHRHLKNHGKSISHQLPPTNHNTDYTSNNYFSNYNTGIGKYDFHPEINRENVNIHSNQTSNSGSLSLFGRLVGAHSSTGSSRVFLPGSASGASGVPQYQLESSTLPRNLLMNCGDSNNNHHHNNNHNNHSHTLKPTHTPTKMHGFNKNFKNKILFRCLS